MLSRQGLLNRCLNFRLARRNGDFAEGKISADPWTVLGVSRDASKAEVRNAFVHLARIYHPDNNPAELSSAKFNEIQNAYREAMKYAIPGKDRTRKEDWVAKESPKHYSPNRDIPKYTKVIEAVDVRSKVDVEAEYNRDPLKVKWAIYTFLASLIFGFWGALLVQTPDLAAPENSATQNYIKTGKADREQILETKIQRESREI
ncbi:unnamed protein product [Oikopleura dioica]|uniref:DnaJ homolog subfamily B member 9 n=1 Tax=Oikopleura dioica TaxID=34765 RepID=E4WZY5_OIKDI|nr:unnamed protein product [Oikopleura dioica]